MQQSSLMEEPAQEAMRTKAAVRRKGLGTVVVGSSGGLGGFLVLGGVLLATAFTARAALKRRQRPGNDAGVERVGSHGANEVAEAANSQSEEETTAKTGGGDGDTHVGHLPEKPMPCSASAQPSIPPQPSAPAEQHLVAASAHPDGGMQRLDEVNEAWMPALEDPKGPATKEQDQPETEAILQDPWESRILYKMEGHEGNCSITKTEVKVLAAEPIQAEVDGAKCLQPQNQTLRPDITSQSFDEHDENAKMKDNHGGVSAEADGSSILLLEDDTVSKDIRGQACQRDLGDTKAKNHEEMTNSELEGPITLQLEDATLAEVIPIRGPDMENEEAGLENDEGEGDHTEQPMPCSALAQPSILSQPSAPPEQHLAAASAHTDGGIQRSDDANEAWSSELEDSKDPATKEHEQPETEAILQDPQDSMFLYNKEGQNSNCDTTKTGVNVLIEPIDVEVDGAKCLHELPNEAQQVDITSQAFDERDENAKVKDIHGEVGAEVERSSILTLEDETVPKDIPSQACQQDHEDAEVKNHEEMTSSEFEEPITLQLKDETLAEGIPIPGPGMENEGAGLENEKVEGKHAETSSPLNVSEIPVLPTSMEEQKNTDTMEAEEPNLSVSQDVQKVETDDKHGQGKILTDVEDKDLDTIDLASQSSDNLLIFVSLEDQNSTSDDVHKTTDSLTNDTVSPDVGEIGAICFEDKDLSKQAPLVEPGTEEEADNAGVQREEKAPEKKGLPSQDFAVSDHPATECRNYSQNCHNNRDICCNLTSQDVNDNELLLKQDKAVQEEIFIEDPTARASNNKEDKPAQESAEETRLPSEDSKHLSTFTSIEAHITASCINQNDPGNLSHETCNDAQQLKDPVFHGEPQQDMPTADAEDKAGNAEGNGSIKEQYQVTYVSDSSPDESTGSSTEGSWPMEETDSSSSLDEYEMKSQYDISKNKTEALKDVPNQQKMVSHGDREERSFTTTKITSLIKPKAKIGFPMKHARTSSLQLVYPIVVFMLVLLIACSPGCIFEACQLLYKIFCPPNPSA